MFACGTILQLRKTQSLLTLHDKYIPNHAMFKQVFKWPCMQTANVLSKLATCPMVTINCLFHSIAVVTIARVDGQNDVIL